MTLPRFTDFLEQNAISVVPRSAYCHHPEWASLYVRVGGAYVAGGRCQAVTLANIEARKPGEGSFGRLLDLIAANHHIDYVIVECVVAQRFRDHLQAMGFQDLNPQDVSYGGFPTYYRANIYDNPRRRFR